MGKESLSTVTARLEGLVFSESEVEKAKSTLLGLLDATVVVRGDKRTESGSPIYEERPDNAIRLAAAVKIVEWGKGKPRQLIELDATIPTGRIQAQQDLLKTIQKNPEIFSSILSTITEAAKQAQAIDVNAVKSENPPQPPES